ncbi:hypothetical protein [Caballeronia sp. AZ7_KS35]|uniref:hypothetical protein n=1 Tax=Caballeronia sp. AZ7_KS35 TaxID=2921762 RepID=UPI002027A85C|nr:hypothetical protein [Caballeronia sp. AZ7_KS35]
MSIQQDYSPDLSFNREPPTIPGGRSLWSFISSSDTTWNEWEHYRVARAGYSSAVPPSVFKTGSVTQVPTNPASPESKDIYLQWALHERWSVSEGADFTARPPVFGSTVGSFDTFSPVTQTIELTIYAMLTIADRATDKERAAIQSAFSNYDGSVDAHEFARKEMEKAGISDADLFDVACTFSVNKKGAPTEHTEQRDATLAPYQKRGGGMVNHGPEVGKPQEREELGSYFDKRKLTAILIFREEVMILPSPSTEPNRIQDPPNPEKSIEKLANDEGAKTEGCGGAQFRVRSYDIVTLLEYPEFKVDWRRFEVKVGCVRVVISLPIVQTRTGQLDLWAYVRTPDNADANGKYFVQVLERCVFRAALSGGVVGIATGNLLAAIETFRAVFIECLKQALNDLVNCLLPSLALIGKTKPGSDWHDI